MRADMIELADKKALGTLVFALPLFSFLIRARLFIIHEAC